MEQSICPSSQVDNMQQLASSVAHQQHCGRQSSHKLAFDEILQEFILCWTQHQVDMSLLHLQQCCDDGLLRLQNVAKGKAYCLTDEVIDAAGCSSRLRDVLLALLSKQCTKAERHVARNGSH